MNTLSDIIKMNHSHCYIRAAAFTMITAMSLTCNFTWTTIAAQETNFGTHPSSPDNANSLDSITTIIADRVSRFIKSPENESNYGRTITRVGIEAISGTSVNNTNANHIKALLEQKISDRGIIVNSPGALKLECIMKLKGKLENAALLISYYLQDDEGHQLCRGQTGMEISDQDQWSQLLTLLGITGNLSSAPLQSDTTQVLPDRQRNQLAEDIRELLEERPGLRLVPKMRTSTIVRNTILRASENSDYAMEIQIASHDQDAGGKPAAYRSAPILVNAEGTEPQVNLQNGDRFQVKLYNANTKSDVGVELFLDGCNSLFLCKSEFPDQKWLVRGRSSAIVTGFLMPKETFGQRKQRLFNVGLAEDRLLDANKALLSLPNGGVEHGTITAIFYDAAEEKQITDEEPYDFRRNLYYLEIQQGEEVQANTKTVKRVFGTRPLAIITARYTSPKGLPID